MRESINYHSNRASEDEILKHLLACNMDFDPILSDRVVINDYAKKIINKAIRFEAWFAGILVGLVAAYCNDQQDRISYITSVSVLKSWTGNGIAVRLLQQCIGYAIASRMQHIYLEVSLRNAYAIELYDRCGFVVRQTNMSSVRMVLHLNNRMDMITERNYNSEMDDTLGSKYAYDFDFDVMHPYMIKSFEPFFKAGNLLELGSFKGNFTTRLLSYFDDITCVEASSIAIEQARQMLDCIKNNEVKFYHSLFEDVMLPRRYNNIILTHVLEHMDDPVFLLKRINNEWLAHGGRCFLVCPNANAPSRQIAVKMGLITHNTAVTSSENEHGHRITYTLDSLERDAVAAGLNIVYRSGIFFKALANFQWDRLLKTNIISKDYLDGCYKLGQQYPDLCSSIFLMCEQGARP